MGLPTLLAYGIPNALQQFIYIISSNLLYPVIIVLIVLIIMSLVELGGFLFEWHNRHRDLPKMEQGAVRASALLKRNDLTGAFNMLGQSCSNSFVHEFLYRLSAFGREIGGHDSEMLDVKLEKLLQDIDFEISKKLERTRFVARAGPMFGLMGTLIPMGPALQGLISGDVEALANNLIIAFGTTVIGLMAGAIGFMVFMVRTRWYGQDMGDIEYLTEILFGHISGESTSSLPGTGYVRPVESVKPPEPQPLEPPEYVAPVEPAKPIHHAITPTATPVSSDGCEGVFGTVRTIATRSGEAVYCDMVLTTSGIVVAKTAGSMLANPALCMILIGSIDGAAILAHIAGYRILPFASLLLFNLLVCAAFVAAIYLVKKRAQKRSEYLGRMQPADLLAEDGYNFEIRHPDVVRIEVERSGTGSSMKILTGNGWIKMGRIERSSRDYLNLLNAALPGKITVISR
ncbi:MAG: MotA/TolQ/ExbB proton channel family protein [Euryarchaeota archaeon]|nr:MotA/TolQ/ExbB proton channel family protein [Euryarchaeota archaeon]